MKPRVYLDNCCFNRPFDDPVSLIIRLESDAKIHIQKQILDGEIELVWSYVLELENTANPYEDQKRSIAQWKSVAVVDIEESEKVIRQSRIIGARGIKNMDALHIACAILSKCDYFLTTDKKVLNKQKQIKDISIMNPLEYVQKVEDRQ